MTASQSRSVGAQPARLPDEHLNPAPVASPRIDLGRLFGVPVMVGLLMANALPLFHLDDADPGGSPATIAHFVARLLTIAFYALMVAAFLRRFAARATTPSRSAEAVALFATYLPFSIGLLPAGTPSLPVLAAANTFLIVGLGFSLWSLRSLGRSFSIIAQARAVVRRGPYRVVRHPLYTGELTAALGFVLLNPGWATIAVWFLLCGLQAYRAHHEEAILLATLPDYAQYQRETPQLLPIAISRAFPKRNGSPDN